MSRVMGCVLVLPAWAALFACAVASAHHSPAPDPRKYSVELVATGMDALDHTLAATSQLQALRKTAPVSAYGLIARARSDRDRLRTVLESFGYYDGSVAITIDGLTLDDPRLGPELTRVSPGTEAHVRIAVKLGPLYHVGHVRIEGTIPPGFAKELGLASGTPAVASKVLAARERLQTALQNAGYAFAKVSRPVAYLEPRLQRLNPTFRVTTGPHVRIGRIRFTGLGHTRKWLLRTQLGLKPGELYDAAKVEQARRNLLGLGLFSSVSVKLGNALDTEGRVPITFQLRQRKRHTVSLSAAYSSDLGGSGGVTWSDRNLSGRADQLDLSATLINLGGTATTGIGYNAGAKYILPDVWHRGETLQFALSGLKQALLAYTEQSESAGVTLSRRISSVWSVSAGMSLQHESDIQYEGVKNGVPVNHPYDYTLAALPLSLIYNSTDLSSPLADQTHGTRGALNLTPTQSLIGQRHPTFAIVQASLAHYFDFSALFGETPGRTVLAMRVLVGVAFGASEFSLPPDQRFYAGGSGTIRGYRYQSVGPQFQNNNPAGGTAVNAINIELRQRIARHFGAAFFVDGGGVSEGNDPFFVSSCTGPSKIFEPQGTPTSVSCVGVGAGFRYYTPIGPIRLDVAVPTVRRPNDDAFEVYVGLGQAF